MTATRKRSETSVIGQIGDDLLAWVRAASLQERRKWKALTHTFTLNVCTAETIKSDYLEKDL